MTKGGLPNENSRSWLNLNTNITEMPIEESLLSGMKRTDRTLPMMMVQSESKQSLVKPFMQQNINIKKQLKEHRLATAKVRKSQEMAQAVSSKPPPSKKEKGKKGAPDPSVTGDGTVEDVKVKEPETARIELTDDEIDSVITDEEFKYDFTRVPDCMKLNENQ